MVQSSPRASTQRIARRLRVPYTRVWRHCMQRACIHTTCIECNISDVAILLRGWNFTSGSMAVTSCFITSCLLTKRNSFTMVSIIHTTLMCGQMRIPTPLWKATFNYIFRQYVVCSSGRSADWPFHLGRSSYRRGTPQISAGGIAPTFGGYAFEQVRSYVFPK